MYDFCILTLCMLKCCMMKRLLSGCLLAAMLLLTGCPYESDTPVDQGSYPAPAWLPGKWQLVKQDGTGTVYDLKANKGNAALLEATTSVETIRKIFLSKVGNSIYLSVYEPSDDMSEEGYYIYRLTKKSNTEIELLPVNEHINISGAGSLKEFLRQHENDETIFEKSELSTYKKL